MSATSAYHLVIQPTSGVPAYQQRYEAENAGTVSTTVNLRAGYDVIRLAKGSPHFSGGTGYAELDYIQLM